MSHPKSARYVLSTRQLTCGGSSGAAVAVVVTHLDAVNLVKPKTRGEIQAKKMSNGPFKGKRKFIGLNLISRSRSWVEGEAYLAAWEATEKDFSIISLLLFLGRSHIITRNSTDRKTQLLIVEIIGVGIQG